MLLGQHWARRRDVNTTNAVLAWHWPWKRIKGKRERMQLDDRETERPLLNSKTCFLCLYASESAVMQMNEIHNGNQKEKD